MTEPDAGTAVDANAPRCYRHPDRITYVSCTRCGRPICPDCMRPASVGFQCPEEVKETRRTTRAPRTVLGGRVQAGGRDVTSVLIGINVVIFVIMTASGTGFISGSPSLLFARFADLPGHIEILNADQTHRATLNGVANGEWYRLVTSMFMHFGIIHLALNMYVLLLVGPPLEKSLGRIRFTALYLIAGFGGSVASFVFGSVTELGAGASGAIFGLFGAYYIVARRIGAETGPILATIGINIAISFAISNIDIRAHLGGLATGALVGAIMAYAPRGPYRTWIQAGGSAVVLAALVVAAVVHAPTVRQDQRGEFPPAYILSLPAAPLPADSPRSTSAP